MFPIRVTFNVTYFDVKPVVSDRSRSYTLKVVGVFVFLRIFIVAFSQELGGSEAAKQWLRCVDHMVQHRSQAAPAAVFYDTFAISEVQEWKQACKQEQATYYHPESDYLNNSSRGFAKQARNHRVALLVDASASLRRATISIVSNR